jgi:hypothetical protein
VSGRKGGVGGGSPDFGDWLKVAMGRKGGSKKIKEKRISFIFRIYFREMNDLENS